MFVSHWVDCLVENSQEKAKTQCNQFTGIEYRGAANPESLEFLLHNITTRYA